MKLKIMELNANENNVMFKIVKVVAVQIKVIKEKF